MTSATINPYQAQLDRVTAWQEQISVQAQNVSDLKSGGDKDQNLVSIQDLTQEINELALKMQGILNELVNLWNQLQKTSSRKQIGRLERHITTLTKEKEKLEQKIEVLAPGQWSSMLNRCAKVGRQQLNINERKLSRLEAQKQVMITAFEREQEAFHQQLEQLDKRREDLRKAKEETLAQIALLEAIEQLEPSATQKGSAIQSSAEVD